MVYTIVVHLYAKDEPGVVDKIKAKLTEAASMYRSDKGTIDWFVMQDHKDPRAFTIVERYESLEDQKKYHLGSPYWPTFDPYIEPLLERPMDLHRLHELDDGKVLYSGDGNYIQ
ncbi:hypothetical protein BD626DRAFT_500791 [Schizophyllum amplum]|uniref:ABM domain-containing protein n=1 Tax=Schizophyllum amplum TaxID=97359 RepID=A0A550CAP3_9AGAR|nr:hypothetical protein BD626DRAFT_500791 [Auriculariopsis ampla]